MAAHSAQLREQPEDLLKVSAYDRASSMLIALLVLVGIAVALIVALWLTTRNFRRPKLQSVVVLEEEPGTQNPPGSARDINPPGVEELDDLVEPDVQDTLAAVTEAVSTIAASLNAIDGAVATRGSGMGDNRKRGNGDAIPRHERWEVKYTSTTLADYVSQLEFFKIDVGAFGGGRPGVDYVYFENGVAKKRALTNPEEDERIYFVWQGGKFQQYDRSLLGQVGVPATGRVIMQFYPKDVENHLAVLEQEKRGARPLRDIQKTYFGIQGGKGNYEFYVINIEWRR
ncbi:MAG: hypothetical protein KDB27_03660 [Planctomycetales bacterium]|nr:hypothetical protein [Planctomycetales bacterium]